jgi:four helix bundle protein
MPNQKIYWTFCDQLIRSVTSIGANIAEARCASSKKDFIKFYDIALKSANESLYWLCLLRDSNLQEIDKADVVALLSDLDIICRMLAKSLITLKKSINKL